MKVKGKKNKIDFTHIISTQKCITKTKDEEKENEKTKSFFTCIRSTKYETKNRKKMKIK